TILLGAFVFNEQRARNPMVPLALFRSRNFTGANLLTLFLYAALSGTFFFFALDLIQVQHYSATAAGASLLPFVILMFALSRWSGGLIDRLGPRLPLTIGPLVAAAGFALFALPSHNANYWTAFFPAVITLGLGMAISVAPLTTTVMGSVSSEQAGVASGINNAVSRAAGLIAIAVFGVIMLQLFGRSLKTKLNQIPINDDVRQAIYNQRVRLGGLEVPSGVSPEIRSSLQDAVAAAFHSGFRFLMLVSAALAVCSAVISWWLIRSAVKNSSTKSG
ncbi:MAG TPA: MFS transporter, partial [Pyrinomonadaceae bacterium]|nr:MFS transporter [Pyrinomonadaceae bacterium]